jgi:hypothetical protein
MNELSLLDYIIGILCIAILIGGVIGGRWWIKDMKDKGQW